MEGYDWSHEGYPFEVDKNFPLNILYLGSMIIDSLPFVVDTTRAQECAGRIFFFDT